MVLGVIAVLYGVFMGEVLIPQMMMLHFSSDPDQITYTARHTPEASSAGMLIAVTTVFHCSLLLCVISFINAVITHPGQIPGEGKWMDGVFAISQDDEQKIRTLVKAHQTAGLRGMSAHDYMVDHLRHHPVLGPSEDDGSHFLENWLAFLRSFPLIERKFPRRAKKGKPAQEGGTVRICSKCNLYKPDRSHHCKHCGHCVLRMDHHCPWIANCVGFYNYKYFLLLVFYASFSSGIVTIYSMPRFMACFQPILDVGYFFAFDIWVILTWLAATVLFIMLGGFFCFHLYIVANAMTTIEYQEKKGSKSKLMMHRFAVANIKYDLGLWRNLCHVLGPCHLWLLPIHPNPLDDGCYWGPSTIQSCC